MTGMIEGRGSVRRLSFRYVYPYVVDVEAGALRGSGLAAVAGRIPAGWRRDVLLVSLLSFCTVTNVCSQLDEGQSKEPRVVVESEDQPERILLETKICKEDMFSKQQGSCTGSPDHLLFTV
jgi:hypothetical protein